MSIATINNTSLIGSNLKKLRQIKDCTLEKAALSTGLSKSFLSLVENGNRRIKFADIRALLNVYGYSLGLFLSQINDQTQKHSVVISDSDMLLLDGFDNFADYSLRLAEPISTIEETQKLLLILPSAAELDIPLFGKQVKIEGFVAAGTLLIEFQNDEHTVKTNEFFRIHTEKNFRFRNFTDSLCKIQFTVFPAAI